MIVKTNNNDPNGAIIRISVHELEALKEALESMAEHKPCSSNRIYYSILAEQFEFALVEVARAREWGGARITEHDDSTK